MVFGGCRRSGVSSLQTLHCQSSQGFVRGLGGRQLQRGPDGAAVGEAVAAAGRDLGGHVDGGLRSGRSGWQLRQGTASEILRWISVGSGGPPVNLLSMMGRGVTPSKRSVQPDRVHPGRVRGGHPAKGLCVAYLPSSLVSSFLRPLRLLSHRNRIVQKRIRPDRGQEPQLRRIGRRQAVDRLHGDDGQPQPPPERDHLRRDPLIFGSHAAPTPAPRFPRRCPPAVPAQSCAAA